MNKKLTTAALQRPEVEEFRNQEKYPIRVLLDDIRSLSNVGSIFRTSDAFNVREVILCGITGRPPHREIQRTALGATESVDWRYEQSAIEVVRGLRKEGVLVVALEQCEETIAPQDLEFVSGQEICLIVGNEVNGVQQDLVDISDVVMEIPQLGTKHSLNVTVAAGIALWEVFKRIRKSRGEE